MVFQRFNSLFCRGHRDVIIGDAQKPRKGAPASGGKQTLRPRKTSGYGKTYARWDSEETAAEAASDEGRAGLLGKTTHN